MPELTRFFKSIMTDHADTQYPTPDTRQFMPERRWMSLVILLTLLLTMVPYLIGWMGAQERPFMWLGYNLDDSCVYLSWMRQAADGSLYALNLFTTDAQKGMLLNPFFLVLGWIARFTHLPLLAIYHLARLVCGAGLLLIVWEFIKITLAHPLARRLSLLCVCFASGLGWLPLPWEFLPTAATCPRGPIDLWQPEAITFLSLLLSPLFCVSLALQVGILLLLFKGEQTGRMRFAVSAGACGFALGLIHTYDILSVSAVWTAYLLLTLAQYFYSNRNMPAVERVYVPKASQQALLQALVAGLCTAPAAAYIYHQLQTETTFLKRANVVTGAALPVWVFMGYGFTIALAIYVVYCAFKANRQHQPSSIVKTNTGDADTNRALPSKNQQTPFVSSAALRLLAVWSAVNILVSYLPVSKFPFQRKMLQGAHLPIAILAGCGLMWLLAQPAVRRSFRSENFAAAVVLIVLSLTNLRFIAREISNYRDNHVQSGQRAYLNSGEVEALQWIDRNTPADSAVQSLPWVVQTGEHSRVWLILRCPYSSLPLRIAKYTADTGAKHRTMTANENN